MKANTARLVTLVMTLAKLLGTILLRVDPSFPVLWSFATHQTPHATAVATSTLQNVDDLLERFSPESRRAMFAARFSATTYGGESLEPEHLLLGIVQRSRARLEQFAERSCTSSLEDELINSISATQKPELDASVRTSSRLGEILALTASTLAPGATIEIEHLLLGLVEDRGRAGELLRGCGVTRDEIVAFLQNQPG